MTREEAYQKFREWCNLGFGHSTMPGSEVLVMAMKSLRPITREQVEKMRPGEGIRWLIFRAPTLKNANARVEPIAKSAIVYHVRIERCG